MIYTNGKFKIPKRPSKRIPTNRTRRGTPTADTEAMDTAEDSDYYQETDADSTSECTVILVVNTDAVSPETNTVPTPIEEVGCPFVTA